MNKAEEILDKHLKLRCWTKTVPKHGNLYNTLLDAVNEALSIVDVSKSLPDHYAGELNTKRIKAYRLLHEQYNLEEGTVRDIFCKGADWYKEQCQKGNVC